MLQPWALVLVIVVGIFIAAKARNKDMWEFITGALGLFTVGIVVYGVANYGADVLTAVHFIAFWTAITFLTFTATVAIGRALKDSYYDLKKQRS